MIRPLIPIDASWSGRVLEVGNDYLYRGYVIRKHEEYSGGYDVLDPQFDPDRDPDGWGLSTYDAMCVINELVDGEPRRKDAALDRL